jgi:hypothetical protein
MPLGGKGGDVGRVDVEVGDVELSASANMPSRTDRDQRARWSAEKSARAIDSLRIALTTAPIFTTT